MESHNGKTSLVLVSTAVALFLAGCSSGPPKMEPQVLCKGVNACKGMSTCKNPNNSCKGQNACKGQGVVSVGQTACLSLGGRT